VTAPSPTHAPRDPDSISTRPGSRGVPVTAMQRHDARSRASSARRTCRAMSPSTAPWTVPGPARDRQQARIVRKRRSRPGVSSGDEHRPDCESATMPRATGEDVSSQRDRKRGRNSKAETAAVVGKCRDCAGCRSRGSRSQVFRRFVASSMTSIQSSRVRSSRSGRPSFGRSSSTYRSRSRSISSPGPPAIAARSARSLSLFRTILARTRSCRSKMRNVSFSNAASNAVVRRSS
jgi:hypothetical protein